MVFSRVWALRSAIVNCGQTLISELEVMVDSLTHLGGNNNVEEFSDCWCS